MHYMHTARSLVLTLCIVLGLSTSGLLIHWMIPFHRGLIYFGSSLSEFEVVGLLAGALGTLLWPVMLVLPVFRRDVLFLNVIFEVTIMLVCCMLWVASAVLVIQWRRAVDFGSFTDFEWENLGVYHRESLALQWLTIALSGIIAIYILSLLTFSVVSHIKGRPVWKICITDLEWENKKPPQFNLTTDSESQTQVGSSYNDLAYSTKSPQSLHLNLPPHFAMLSSSDSQTDVDSSPYLNPPITATHSATSFSTLPSASIQTSLYPETPNLPQV